MKSLFPVLLSVFIIGCDVSRESGNTISWGGSIKRTWAGPDFWTNRLQDWEVSNGRLNCIYSGENRNAFLLTSSLNDSKAEFTLRFKSGFTDLQSSTPNKDYVAVRLGISGKFNDYRDDAIYGEGIDIGLTRGGQLFVGGPENGTTLNTIPQKFKMNVSGKPAVNDGYKLNILLSDDEGKEIANISIDTISAGELSGGLALVSHHTANQEKRACWFEELSVQGGKVSLHPERALGPVIFNQYTLSRGTLKMTAQMAPVGDMDPKEVVLEIDKYDNGWVEAATAMIDPDARTATFRVENWTSDQNVDYRIVYDLAMSENNYKRYEYSGTVRKNPIDQETIKVAAFTGNNSLGFPNNDLVENVTKHDPDFMFFSGDQIYEGVGGFGVQRAPIEKATLDYLRKWYMYGWSFGDLFRDRPVVAIPDDHDVYHGNIWGAGGKSTGSEGSHADMQDRGGYKQPARWVNMVQRTQTAHLPDPYDPTPVEQGISVYYTDILYGGVSFAVIEDRKWKSPPKALLPEAEVHNGWIQNPYFDPVTEGDVPEAKLLGERQLKFLEYWAGDWTGGAIMKAVLSQTIFANVATLPEGERHGRIIPRLRILEKGEYAPHDYPVADMDSNGWPQTGRNKALEKIRKASAVHIAGDQHLGSTIQYGIDEYRDGPYAICVPSISNIWPRRWYPSSPGENHEEGQPQYTGDFRDGFGNRMTVLAVSNPTFTGREPSNLYDRATGYGIIEFNKATREITMANWERDTDPTLPNSKPYEGWPISISQFDNDGRKVVAYLPEITVTGLDLPPVIQVFDEEGEMIYTFRMKNNSFTPGVFEEGNYVINIGEPGTDKWESLKVSTSDSESIKVQF